MTQKLTESKNEIDEFRIFFGDFNSPLSVIDETTKQKISNYRKDLNNTSNQFHPIDSSRIICTITTEYIFFSSAYEICTKKDHMLGHKTSVKKQNY